jgi:hypothetical protein
MADTFLDMNHEYDNDLVKFSKHFLLQVIKPPASAGPFVKIVQIRDSSSQ